MSEKIGLVILAVKGPGVLHQVTGVIGMHNGNITLVELTEDPAELARTYFEIEMPGEVARMVQDIEKLPVVRTVRVVKTMEKIYGKRIIIMGGGRTGGPGGHRRRFPKPTGTISAASTSRWIRFRWWASSSWPTRCAPWPGFRGRGRWCWRER